MNLTTTELTRARKLAIVTVASTFSTVALAALALPANIASGVLPVLALTLPFVAAGVLDSRIDHMTHHA
jgi:hypothetical protein